MIVVMLLEQRETRTTGIIGLHVRISTNIQHSISYRVFDVTCIGQHGMDNLPDNGKRLFARRFTEPSERASSSFRNYSQLTMIRRCATEESRVSPEYAG